MNIPIIHNLSDYGIKWDNIDSIVNTILSKSKELKIDNKLQLQKEKELQLQKENGIKRKRVGFEMLDRGIARNGYTILNKNDEKIGFVTSGTMSPSLQKSIGMGYVNSEYAKRDTELYIQIRNKKLKALVVKLPFFKS